MTHGGNRGNVSNTTQGKARGKGTGTVWKKGNRFYFRVRVDGTEKNTMLRNADGKPATTRPDAEKAALALTPILLGKSQDDIAEYIVESRKIQNPLILPLARVWSAYLAQTSRPDSGESTLGLYEWFWNDFLRWLNEARPSISHLSQVNDEIVQAFFGTLSSRNISGRTYNAYRQALRLIHKHLLLVLEQEHNPFDKIATRLNGSISRREFSEEQVEAIFQGFETGFFYDTEGEVLTKGRERVRVTKKIEFKPMHPEQLKVLLYLCCYTGCRGQDGCLMHWSNVDLPHNRISFTPRKTARKTGKTVIIPLHPALYQALEEAKQWQSTNQQGQDYILPAIARRYQYNASGIQKDVMKIIRCATGLKTSTDEATGKRVLAVNLYSLHSFRHTFVSFCANAGVSLDIVAEIVGHGSPIMTKHYAHFSNEAKSAILQALPSKTTKTTNAADGQNDQAPEARDELLKMLDGMDPQKVQELLELAQQKKQPRRPSRKTTTKPDEGQ